ncbi:MAG: endonuclease MutS2 [Selenomonadaceae bacterium]|nr:endonuclease MutS2 [Selenomonadaceae bacterium]
MEFEKIRQRLKNCASSNLGKELAAAIVPDDNFDAVHENLQWTTEAVKIFAVSAPPLGGVRDIRETLEKIKLGSSATSEEFLDILSTMYAMRNVKKFFKETEIDAPKLKTQAAQIEILGNLEKQIENTVDERGLVRDTASVELQKIRRELRSAQGRVKTEIFSILHDPAKQKYFQDAIVTMRGDRYVLPVKTEYKSQVQGIVHDQSATGATLFIEPMAIVNLNNEIRQLEVAERNEVARILRLLSDAVRKNSLELLINVDILAEVDLVFAKAKLAYELNATEPILSNVTDIKSARHPLINPKVVVPIDIKLGGEFTILLVTGPNTGGKTVSMKTLGLLVMMTQCGLYIPAASNSKIAVYTDIYADIGDEQSIEQSLSTFSAHMKKIVTILREVRPTDLVLIDEIGAGTDPDEGAALAMSILSRLLKIKTPTIATTHYSELKTFAYTTTGIENACVEFNGETLQPTYRLLIGIPGSSNAFAISQRLGLQQSLIRRAKKFLKADHANFEQVISELESERTIYEQRNIQMQIQQKQIEFQEKKIAEIRGEIEKSKGEIIKKAREKSAAMVREAKREVEEIIASLKEQFDDLGVKRRQQAIQAARDKIREAEIETAPIIFSDKSVGKKINKNSLMIGDTIYIKPLDQNAKIISIDLDAEKLTAQVGSLTTTIKFSDCRFISHEEKFSAPAPTTDKERGSEKLLQKVMGAKRNLDVRGMMVHEAEQVCEKFIDDAQLAGLKQILIIHGKGTGLLRQGIQDFLRRHNSVADFSTADLDEGGAGATLVTLI